MKREEFLKQLEQLLDGISEEEKADALAFYRSYFEDAGEENEESVIAELESPEKVAQSIKKNLGMEKENGSYGMPADQNPEWNKNDDMFVKSEEVPKEKKGGWSAAAIVLVVLTSPFWLTLLLVVASLLLAVVAILFGIAVAVVAVMASLVFAGFLLIGFGCSTLFTGGVAVGLGLTGAGLLVLGLGILAVLLVVWVSGVFLPWAVRGIIGLCKKPFEKKKVGWQHEKIYKNYVNHCSVIAWCRTDLLRCQYCDGGLCMAYGKEWRTPVWKLAYWSGGTLL